MKPHTGSEVNLLSSYLPGGVEWCEVYEIIHFLIHYKLTSLPMRGLIAQLVEQRTGSAEVTGSNPVEALIFFFRLLLSSCLNWKIYCDDHSSLSSTTAVQKWIISYTSHQELFCLVTRLVSLSNHHDNGNRKIHHRFGKQINWACSTLSLQIFLPSLHNQRCQTWSGESRPGLRLL